MKILDAARKRFVEQGYETTNISDVLDDTGISRGALYHHFESKRDLMEAVFVATSNESIELAAKSLDESGSSLERLLSACINWLNTIKNRETAAIILDQGPAALGWKRARELEEARSLSLIKRSLESAVQDREIEVASIDVAARLVNALLAEAALAVFHDSSDKEFTENERMVEQFIMGLKS